MRVACGTKSVSFQRHGSYDELQSFLAEAQHHVVLGIDSVGYFGGFMSLDIRDELTGEVARVGIVVETEHPLPQLVCSVRGDYLAVGFNRTVAFLRGWPPAAKEHGLDCCFYFFIPVGDLLIAVHELGCVAFETDTGDRRWRISTDVIQSIQMWGNYLIIRDAQNMVRRLDIESGAEQGVPG
ncbi:MAG TPA: hypothetical protein EYP04_09120 [Anaerolineae bacterium]|nr:hypothetical protein [Anaerolineae bacterium]